MTKELKKDGYEARIMPVEIGARGFVGSSAYGLLSKLSIGGNKRTKALRLLAETAENSSRWIWSRRNERDNGTVDYDEDEADDYDDDAVDKDGHFVSTEPDILPGGKSLPLGRCLETEKVIEILQRTSVNDTLSEVPRG
ncbi:polyprotein [Plakobranchus ocellatus]|uniref:Polyprotein n=1 Tax=Plakobranchus ocellatus TaxID=259542 RepID=A0AAV4CJ98_9GAST|nr:polyprotein [Plakobranchus ocellatus]